MPLEDFIKNSDFIFEQKLQSTSFKTTMKQKIFEHTVYLFRSIIY